MLFRSAIFAIFSRYEKGTGARFSKGMPAKLNSTQLRRQAGGKDCDDQCCQPLLLASQVANREMKIIVEVFQSRVNYGSFSRLPQSFFNEIGT